MSPTTSPTTSPSMAPTVTPVVTIAMDSALFWNITCPLNGTADEVADIVAKSVYDGTVGETDGLQYVYVYELCGESVSSTPYPSGRRLQTEESAIRLKSIVTTTCNGCEDDMFNEATDALVKIVENGSLSESIQDNSGDVIAAAINPDLIVTNSEVITNPPTAAPITMGPTVDPDDPSTSSPKPTPKPTPRPSTASKSGKNSKATSSPTTASKSVKSTKVV